MDQAIPLHAPCITNNPSAAVVECVLKGKPFAALTAEDSLEEVAEVVCDAVGTAARKLGVVDGNAIIRAGRIIAGAALLYIRDLPDPASIDPMSDALGARNDIRRKSIS